MPIQLWGNSITSTAFTGTQLLHFKYYIRNIANHQEIHVANNILRSVVSMKAMNFCWGENNKTEKILFSLAMKKIFFRVRQWWYCGFNPSTLKVGAGRSLQVGGHVLQASSRTVKATYIKRPCLKKTTYTYFIQYILIILFPFPKSSQILLILLPTQLHVLSLTIYQKTKIKQ